MIVIKRTKYWARQNTPRKYWRTSQSLPVIALTLKFIGKDENVEIGSLFVFLFILWIARDGFLSCTTQG